MSSTPVNPPVQPDSGNPSPFKPKPQPTPALMDALQVVRNSDHETIKAAHEEIEKSAPLPKEHWWHKAFHDLGNAIGEAKFGG